jgi:heptosyltransferase I
VEPVIVDAVSQRLRGLHPRRVLVIKPSALGDVVQSLPLLPVLRRSYPLARIDWVIQRELCDLVAGHPDLDTVLPMPRRPTAREWWTLLTTIRANHYDVVFDLQGLARTAALCWASGAPFRVGLQTAREGAGWSVHAVLPGTDRSVPAHARHWRLAEALQDDPGLPRLLITVPATEFQRARQWLKSRPKPWIAVQAGAQWITKRWPVEHFAELAHRALHRTGGTAILVGSPGEVVLVSELEQQLRQRQPNGAILNLAGQTNLKSLAAVLSQCDLLISNDSGPLHLAAGLGVRCLGLFTCTSAVRSGPPIITNNATGEPDHVLVSTQVPCAASYCKQCPHQGAAHLACLRELSVDRAWTGLQPLLFPAER